MGDNCGVSKWWQIVFAPGMPRERRHHRFNGLVRLAQFNYCVELRSGHWTHWARSIGSILLESRSHAKRVKRECIERHSECFRCEKSKQTRRERRMRSKTRLCEPSRSQGYSKTFHSFHNSIVWQRFMRCAVVAVMSLCILRAGSDCRVQ